MKKRYLKFVVVHADQHVETYHVRWHLFGPRARIAAPPGGKVTSYTVWQRDPLKHWSV